LRWISIRPTTSASSATSAATILSRWRTNSAGVSAPRQSVRVFDGRHCAPAWSIVVK